MKTKQTMTPAQKRMRQIVADFQDYVTTYPQQAYYADYIDKTFVADMLYGIGLAFDPIAFKGASGFEAFKAELKAKYL